MLVSQHIQGFGKLCPRWGAWLSQSYSTGICFLLADDLEGKCVFVQTSPLARALFVSLQRPFNSCCSDIIIKYSADVPSHKSSVTDACCGASCIHRYCPALLGWFNSSYNQGALLLKPHTRQPLVVFHGCLLGGRKNSIIRSQRGKPPKTVIITVENSLTLNLWNNQQRGLNSELSTAQGLVNWHNESPYKTSRNTTALEGAVLGLWTDAKSKLNRLPTQPSRNKELCQSRELKMNYSDIFFNSYVSLTSDRLRLKIRRSSVTSSFISWCRLTVMLLILAV